ncbi:MAG: hypothetical protein WA118_08535 [Carboxydocellales bacterium]
MGFVVRTVFIATLGIEYLGVDGLFSNILTILSLTNLGFDTAIIYSLYKPLAENDQSSIIGLMKLYQKAYRIIGIVVLLLGLSLLPFLPSLINGKTYISNLELIYLLFLANSVVSYFFVYKQSIIIADQKNHIISKIYSVFTVVSNLGQIILLILTKDYLAVLSSQIALKVLQNLYLSNKVDKLYPFLNEKNNIMLSEENKRKFFRNLYSLMIYRISGVVINGTDNIVIAKFVGLIWVGVCSNYLLIINTLNSFLSHIFYSITASIGNLNVKEDQEKKYLIFRIVNFSSFWIYGFCAVCLWSLINPFISLWLGQQYVLNKVIVFAIILNFYTTGMQNAATTFRDTTGLFKKAKHVPIIASVLNIVVSVILAKTIGIAGVFLGTVISRFCTYFWYDPYLIFNLVFHKQVKTYFFRYLLFGLLVIAAAFISDTIGSIQQNNVIIELAIRGVLCLIIPNAIFLTVFRRSMEFNHLWNIMRPYLNDIPSKFVAKKHYDA